MPSFADIATVAASLTIAARATGQRRTLVLAGEQTWCLDAAQAALANEPGDGVLWIGEHAPKGSWRLRGAQVHDVLGREVAAVVFDAHSGFDPDAFGAVAGCVRGGGLLLLLTPPFFLWPQFPDPEHTRITVAPYPADAVTGRFLTRLARVLATAEGTAVIEQGGRLPVFPQTPAAAHEQVLNQEIWRTADQREAVAAIMKVVSGHRRRPLVLTSDRGRGKSAAFGIAAAQLLRQGLSRILVTAPRRIAVETLFRHAQQLLPQALIHGSLVRYGDAVIEFVAPDELTLDPRPADLLLVDEAAGIPTPLLEGLLTHYSRIAFATTVHGYEGSGRGFALRFQKVLDERTPGWKRMRLRTPVRWSPNDPLERLVFRALLLDALPAEDTAVASARPDNCIISRLDRNRLIEDETTLSQLFGLLVLSHYRTRPYDLRHLLDGPNLEVYLMRYGSQVVATALVAREGGFDSEIATAVYAGRRRLQGHLIPQSLAAHVGLEAGARLTGARIMRIAVHPAVQGRGLATRLVAAITRQVQNNGLDWIGSSFGATPELLRFWARSGLLPVRVGLKREASSGAHSVMVLYPLTSSGGALFTAARERLGSHLPHLLADPLRDLAPSLAAWLLRRTTPPELGCDRPGHESEFSDLDWRELVAFAFALRGFEVTLAPIWRLTCVALTDPHSREILNSREQTLLIACVLQRRRWQEKDWQQAATRLGIKGRAQTLAALRQALRPLVLHYGGETARREVDRLGGVRERQGLPEAMSTGGSCLGIPRSSGGRHG